MLRLIITVLFFSMTFSLFGQIELEGYVYESGNRGFIKGAEVAMTQEGKTEIVARAITDEVGKYAVTLNAAGKYDLYIIKKPYFESVETIDIKDQKKKIFLKHEVVRQPGYIFDITIAEKNPAPDSPRDALKGALIEVYNNTTQKEELVIESLQTPDFKVDLLKGNHYTILIRKDGFLSKRMEAFVDVEGCILCFEGIGSVRPGVSDNLTNENRTGTLLANVEMDRYFQGKVIGLNNIYYDFGKSKITDRAAQELNKVGTFLKDNPNLKVELGSHTDSRGKKKSNLKLSNNRAKSAVSYLVENNGIDAGRISSQGYGESKLVNKCGDGVNCTEEEHSLNRRTELKILDFIDISLSKSLRAMKTEELMDQMINNFGNNEEVRVGAGGDLQNIIQQLDKSRLTQTRTFTDVEQASVPSTKQAEVKKAQDQIDNRTASDTQVSNVDPDAYSGYRIVIHFSRFQLPNDHEIYTDFDGVIDYKTADRNHLYMIGNYQSKGGARQRLSQLSSKYDNAYIVRFENGIRVE